MTEDHERIDELLAGYVLLSRRLPSTRPRPSCRACTVRWTTSPWPAERADAAP